MRHLDGLVHADAGMCVHRHATECLRIEPRRVQRDRTCVAAVTLADGDTLDQWRRAEALLATVLVVERQVAATTSWPCRATLVCACW